MTNHMMTLIQRGLLSSVRTMAPKKKDMACQNSNNGVTTKLVMASTIGFFKVSVNFTMSKNITPW